MYRATREIRAKLKEVQSKDSPAAMKDFISKNYVTLDTVMDARLKKVMKAESVSYSQLPLMSEIKAEIGSIPAAVVHDSGTVYIPKRLVDSQKNEVNLHQALRQIVSQAKGGKDALHEFLHPKGVVEKPRDAHRNPPHPKEQPSSLLPLGTPITSVESIDGHRQISHEYMTNRTHYFAEQAREKHHRSSVEVSDILDKYKLEPEYDKNFSRAFRKQVKCNGQSISLEYFLKLHDSQKK